jgi:hypothetical protein
MALATDVKKYIACWMQLGTKVWLRNGQPVEVKKVIQGGQYSSEFEALWSAIDRPASDRQAGDRQTVAEAYLDGTSTTLQDLLGNNWEIVQCARCTMPVAIATAGVQPLDCPCQDLENWPNTEVPCPRPPIDSLTQLKGIQGRLHETTQANKYRSIE